jgi:ribosomal protein S18 acetylase RimI-like enzyme
MSQPIEIREAVREDLAQIAELVVRLKRLNGEFDALLAPSSTLVEDARRYVEEAFGRADSLLLVAARGGKVIGVVKAEIRRRLFYEPKVEGEIQDFYVLPEFRRSGVGARMLREAIGRLKARGAELVTAEFPSHNLIAVNFYVKQGFRALVSVYASAI